VERLPGWRAIANKLFGALATGGQLNQDRRRAVKCHCVRRFDRQDHSIALYTKRNQEI
jgi:hypothetical protein